LLRGIVRQKPDVREKPFSRFVIIWANSPPRPMLSEKSIKERFVHALLFEVLAIALCAPLGA